MDVLIGKMDIVWSSHGHAIGMIPFVTVVTGNTMSASFYCPCAYTAGVLCLARVAFDLPTNNYNLIVDKALWSYIAVYAIIYVNINKCVNYRNI